MRSPKIGCLEIHGAELAFHKIQYNDSYRFEVEFNDSPSTGGNHSKFTAGFSNPLWDSRFSRLEFNDFTFFNHRIHHRFKVFHIF